MTEEEAKTKWCPMVRAPFICTDNDIVTTVTATNAGVDGIERRGHCVGSECMWWVWETHVVEGTATEVPTEVHGQGYCGAVK